MADPRHTLSLDEKSFKEVSAISGALGENWQQFTRRAIQHEIDRTLPEVLHLLAQLQGRAA